MQDTATEKSPDGRKPYEKPRVEAVELEAGEAVLSNCKTTDGLFNIWGNSNCGIVFECRNVGS
jgi:hypothetical protein